MYTFIVPIFVQIIPIKKPIEASYGLSVIITPAQTISQNKLIEYPTKIKTFPIEINVSDVLIKATDELVTIALESYIDEDRELKTLLNYGEDRQSVIVGQRRGPLDLNGLFSIQLKLLQPVPSEVTTETPVFLSREVAKSIIDKVRIRFAPELDATPYLRPKNLAADIGLNLGKSLNDVTLKVLRLQSGSVGVTDSYLNKTFEDELFRRWYSYDFNSSELNIDFTDYNNFIFYGSATLRLAAFREKLKLIETLESSRLQFLSSSYTPSTSSAAVLFIQEKSAQYAKEKEDIIRAFDRYEQYLYFTPSGSSSPYSASAYYADEGYEYNPIGYWPKNSSGSLYSVYSETAQEWFTSQSLIAQRFDEFNENNLVNTIPTHVREHEDNSPYITFVAMIGHFFDTIKPYVDQMPYIWSRDLDPNRELSKDLVNDIAEAVGFRLPTLNSIYNLSDNILGTDEYKPRRDITAEIYKRLLHNLPFFVKSKGTKTSLETLLKIFGITPQLITVKESATTNIAGSYYVFEEFTNGLRLTESTIAYAILNLATTLRSPKTIQLTIRPAKSKYMTLLTGDNLWAMNVRPHPTNTRLGRIEVTSGSNQAVLMSSSYQEIFEGDLLSINLQRGTSQASLQVTQVEGEDLLFTDTGTDVTQFNSLWDNTQFIYLGGAGPRVVGRYEGTIDEFRMWSDTLSNETIINYAFDPASNAGDTYESAATNLLYQMSFNNVDFELLTASSSLINESPYREKTNFPSLETIPTVNITDTSFIRYNRTIRQEIMQAGGSGYISNKVKVASTPTFISETNGKQLYRSKSIVVKDKRNLQVGKNKITLTVSPTEIINQNIIRNFGLENVNAVLGAPSTLYTTFEKSLSKLKNYYTQYYYIDVNFNKFIRILGELNSVLDQVVDYFIPSKATLLKGVSIEPSILEQVKIPAIKNVKVYGKNSRKTRSASSQQINPYEYGATFNLEDTISVIEQTTVVGTYNKTPVGIVDDSSINQVSGKNYVVNTGSIELENVVFTTKIDKYTGTVEPENLNLTAKISDYKSEIETEDTKILSGKNLVIKTILPEVGILETTGKYVLYTASLYNNVPEIQTVFDQYKVTVTDDSTYNVNVDYVQLSQNITTENDIKIIPSYSTIKVKHTYYSSESLSVEKPAGIDLGLDNMKKIKYDEKNYGSPGAEPYNRVYTRKLFNTEIDVPRIGDETSLYVPALYDIPPSTDFRDFGVYTYFNDPEGIYYFPETIKIPAYSRPLNLTWNIDDQRFVGEVSWSYGSGYNLYDVVKQDVDQYIFPDNVDGKRLSKLSRAGNGKYYVFKTRPAYTPPEDGTSFYSGSVPSYLPPSLDKENWEPLRFTPVQKRLPRRVVFDTFTVKDPSITNFKVTTISLGKIVDIPARYIDVFTINGISGNSSVSGEFIIQNIANLFALQTNTSGLRIRFYRTALDRDVDINRSVETLPTGSHGVLVDITVTDTSVNFISPIVTLIANSTPPAGKIFYTINNLDSVNKLGISLSVYYFAIEIEPRIPFGYLRKHYRFFRDNSTGTKRRNYVGCKNTLETTIDGLPPVQVFLSEGTDLIVSPTITRSEIQTGGGGTLNVT